MFREEQGHAGGQANVKQIDEEPAVVVMAKIDAKSIATAKCGVRSREPSATTGAEESHLEAVGVWLPRQSKEVLAGALPAERWGLIAKEGLIETVSGELGVLLRAVTAHGASRLRKEATPRLTR